MKKIFVAILFLMFSISSICNAFELDKNRWVEIASNENDILYIDKLSLSYTKDSNYDNASVWICYYNKEKKDYSLADDIINFKDNTLKTKQIVLYDSKGKYLKRLTSELASAERVVPGSMGEATLLYVKYYKP